MPARLSLTKVQRDALFVSPDTEEAFIRQTACQALMSSSWQEHSVRWMTVRLRARARTFDARIESQA